MSLDAVTLPTPYGAFTVIADAEVVVASGFVDDPERLGRWLGDSAAEIRVRDDLGRISEVMRAYFDGDVTAIDSLPTRAKGSPVMQRLWGELRRIPAGEVRTYAQLGGDRRMSRVAGAACARNPIPIIVPCHRVVQTGGGLGGFAWGLAMKQSLLDHEAAAVRSRPVQPVLAVAG
jgi:methylated-DNA-[protein]-cysteine S-methyltransferase